MTPTQQTDDAGRAEAPVGVLGAGRMGMPIVGHLVRGGHVVLVYDPDATREPAVTERGATFCSDVHGLTGCATLLVCVGFEEQVQELLTGAGSLGEQVGPGTIFAVLSTVSPTFVQRLAAELQSRGVHVLDAPVTRGSWAADAGELETLIGGPAEPVARLSDVARAYSSDVVHVGPVGAGQVAKAVNNLILWACLVASHEGLALAQEFGVDTDALREALMISSASNDALDNWGKQTMAWADDDMRIVAEMARQRGLALPQADVNRDVCRTLKPHRYDLDWYGRQRGEA